MCASFSFLLSGALSLSPPLSLSLSWTSFCDTISNANDDECQCKVTPAALASFPHDCHSRMGQTNRLCPLFVAVLCVSVDRIGKVNAFHLLGTFHTCHAAHRIQRITWYYGSIRPLNRLFPGDSE